MPSKSEQLSSPVKQLINHVHERPIRGGDEIGRLFEVEILRVSKYFDCAYPFDKQCTPHGYTVWMDGMVETLWPTPS
jgi:hypothetical protein